MKTNKRLTTSTFYKNIVIFKFTYDSHKLFVIIHIGLKYLYARVCHLKILPPSRQKSDLTPQMEIKV